MAWQELVEAGDQSLQTPIETAVVETPNEKMARLIKDNTLCHKDGNATLTKALKVLETPEGFQMMSEVIGKYLKENGSLDTSLAGIEIDVEAVRQALIIQIKEYLGIPLEQQLLYWEAIGVAQAASGV